MRGRDPVQRGFRRTLVWSITASCRGIVNTPQFDDVPGRILNHFLTRNEVSVTEAYFATGSESEKLLGWIFSKVVLLDVQHTREGNFPSARSRIFGIIDCIEFFRLTLGIVLDDHTQRTKNGHYTGRMPVEIVANRKFKHPDVDNDVITALSDADGVEESPNRRRSEASAPKRSQGRHSRVVPASHRAVIY